jgi:hypothetical protein
MAAQFTLTNARELRWDSRWMARATSSLPVPVSPVMRTVESLGATFEMRESRACKEREAPTMSSNIEVSSISSRRAAFSWCSLSSARLRSSISVPATYQRITLPCRSRSGWKRKRNHRYLPSFLSNRASVSWGDPLKNLFFSSPMRRSLSSGWG